VAPEWARIDILEILSGWRRVRTVSDSCFMAAEITGRYDWLSRNIILE